MDAWGEFFERKWLWSRVSWNNNTTDLVYRLCQAYVKYPDSKDLHILENSVISQALSVYEARLILKSETEEVRRDPWEVRTLKLPNGEVSVMLRTVPLIRTNLFRVVCYADYGVRNVSITNLLWKCPQFEEWECRSSSAQVSGIPYVSYPFSKEQCIEYCKRLVENTVTDEFLLDMIKNPPQGTYMGDHMWRLDSTDSRTYDLGRPENGL